MKHLCLFFLLINIYYLNVLEIPHALGISCILVRYSLQVYGIYHVLGFGRDKCHMIYPAKDTNCLRGQCYLFQINQRASDWVDATWSDQTRPLPYFFHIYDPSKRRNGRTFGKHLYMSLAAFCSEYRTVATIKDPHIRIDQGLAVANMKEEQNKQCGYGYFLEI